MRCKKGNCDHNGSVLSLNIIDLTTRRQAFGGKEVLTRIKTITSFPGIISSVVCIFMKDVVAIGGTGQGGLTSDRRFLRVPISKASCLQLHS